MAYDWERVLAEVRDSDTGRRLSAAVALEEALTEELEGGRADWEPLVRRALPVLVEAIGDTHKGVQVHAANCLEFLCYHSAEVVPALRDAMAGPDEWRGWGAAIVMARMGYWFSEMEQALRGAFGAADRDVRWAAAGFSLRLGRNHPEAVIAVSRTLTAESPLARKMAAYCLGAMGQYAEVEADLAAQLGDRERDVRRAVVLGLDKLPALSPGVRQQIASLKQDPDKFVRRTATAVAAKFGL